MNVAAFAVLTVLPSRSQRPGARNGVGAETFEDLAGQGRRNIPLGLAMAVTCFSLTGLPLTVGFFGKVFLIKPAFDVGLKGLVIIMMINAAISAGYYLRIVAAMFLRDDPETAEAASAADAPSPVAYTVPLSIVLAIILSVGATLLFGTVYSAAQLLSNSSETAVQMDSDSSGLRFDLAEPEEDTPADALPEPTARAAD
jgi:NADH:ubiquinone oxidoreductase subunit 2 (subunit N)